MQYSGKRLKPNHSNALPRYIVAVKTSVDESRVDGSKNLTASKLKCGVCVSVRYQRDKVGSVVERSFYNAKQFWSRLYELSARGRTVWLIGHNILYDLRLLGYTEEMDTARIVLDSPRRIRSDKIAVGEDYHDGGVFCIKAPPTIIGFRVSDTQGRIVCVDLLNWFDSTIDDIATASQKKLATMPLYSKRSPEWLGYCSSYANFILGTFTDLMEWNRTNNLGMFRYTIAAQAMAAYRHRFMPREIFLHDNYSAKKFERTAYYGGRTECFYVGPINEQVYQYDVTAFYPHLMRSVPVPYKLVRYEPAREWSEPPVDLDWANSIADVLVRSRNNLYPVKRGGYCVFPIGAFRTTLAGSELRRARQYGDVLAVGSYATYETDILFADFVETFWALRCEYAADGKHLYEMLAKKISNSLYGKWSQQSEEWERRPSMIAPQPWASWIGFGCGGTEKRIFRSFGYHVQELVGRGELSKSFTAISAFITAAGRGFMNRLRGIAGQENCLYQCTDSLIVNATGSMRLKHAGEVEHGSMGKLKCEYTSDRGHIYGCNDYLLGDKQVIAGRSGKYVTLADSQMLQQKSSAVQGLFSASPASETYMQEMTWKRQGRYPKGITAANGYVEPFELDEIGMPLRDNANESATI
jgi:hypothetical protein